MNKLIKEIIEQATEVYDSTKTGVSVAMVDQRTLIELLIRDVINEVSQYSCWGEADEKETYEDGFIDGTRQGYMDAVEQIVQGLKDRYGLGEDDQFEEEM